AASATTDASSQASVNLTGTTAGTATVTARSATGSTSSVAVTMVSAAPVITAFAERSISNNLNASNKPNRVYFDSNGFGGCSYSFYENNLFSWSATNATNYEVVDPWGVVIYSGTAGSFNTSRAMQVNTRFCDVTSGVFTLRAYNGSAVSTSTVSVQLIDTYLVGSN
ncbi:TPA: hypothetical protein ACIRVE_005594, partial [Pseudomonas putida]